MDRNGKYISQRVNLGSVLIWYFLTGKIHIRCRIMMILSRIRLRLSNLALVFMNSICIFIVGIGTVNLQCLWIVSVSLPFISCLPLQTVRSTICFLKRHLSLWGFYICIVLVVHPFRVPLLVRAFSSCFSFGEISLHYLCCLAPQKNLMVCVE